MGQLEALVVVLILLGIVFYGSAALVSVRRRDAGLVLFAIGSCGSLVLVSVNWLACGEPPLGNMYHVQVFLTLCFLPLHLVLTRRHRMGWSLPYFALASVIFMISALFLREGLQWRRVPALQSGWFVPHVVSYMFSYALAAVAFLITCVGAWRRRREAGDDGGQHAEGSYQTVRLAFPFMTFGMLSGALWAEEAWGAYWSWDPKEVWSLITWTLYVIYFHCRTRRSLVRYAGLAQILAFLALLTTFFMVNLLPKLSSVLHSYA